MYSEGREYNATETTSDDGAAASGGRDMCGVYQRPPSPPPFAAISRPLGGEDGETGRT